MLCNVMLDAGWSLITDVICYHHDKFYDSSTAPRIVKLKLPRIDRTRDNKKISQTRLIFETTTTAFIILPKGKKVFFYILFTSKSDRIEDTCLKIHKICQPIKVIREIQVMFWDT